MQDSVVKGWSGAVKMLKFKKEKKGKKKIVLGITPFLEALGITPWVRVTSHKPKEASKL